MEVVRQEGEARLQLNLAEIRYFTGISAQHAEVGNYAETMRATHTSLMAARSAYLLRISGQSYSPDYADLLRDYAHESDFIRKIAHAAITESEDQLPDDHQDTPNYEVVLPVNALSKVYVEAGADAEASLDELLAASDLVEIDTATRDQLYRQQTLAQSIQRALHPLMRDEVL